MSEYRNLKKALLHLDRERHHLSFLTSCRDLGVIPRFLKTRSKFISRYHAKEKYNFEERCLKTIIRAKHALVNSISKKIYGFRNDGLYRKFATYAVGGVFDYSMAIINRFRSEQDQQITERHAKKLDSLTAGISIPIANKSSGFINLSSHIFNDRQLNLLNKGPKYIHHSTVRPIDFIPQLEDIVKQVEPSQREQLRCHMFLAYSKFLKTKDYSSYNEKQIINSIRNIPNLVFLPTDKSNKLAALDKQVFLQKMNDTIQSLDCTVVTNDPLQTIINKTVKIVKEFKKTDWPDEVRKMAKLNNLGIIPKMVSVLKDHKQALPLRPIVVRCQSPTFFVEKTLVLILKDLLPMSPHALKSTDNFIQRLEALQLPGSFIMFSLDVVSLYPSVDMSIAAKYITDQLNCNPSLSTHMKNTIISAFNLIVSSNYFSFNNQVFYQNTGAPMGSPISGLAAECILRPIEENFLADVLIKPVCWLRFVDDIFGIWTSSTTEFIDFFNSLNNFDPNIKFTMELEQNNSLAFLDVSLKRQNGAISRSVFRKSINSNCTIPHDANTTLTYKQAAYKSHIRRAYRICTPDTINDELTIIRRIAVQNGFPLSFINNIISTVSESIQHPPTCIANNTDKRLSLQYAKGLHEKISRFLKPHNVHVVAQAGIKLKDLLKPNIDPTPPMKLPGVYEIPIEHPDNSKTYYIGQTTRKLEVRLKEHRNDIRNSKQNSAIARTIYNNPMFKVLFDEAKIIAPFTNPARTLIRESLEIHRRKSEVCNDQDSYNISNLWLSLIQ